MGVTIRENHSNTKLSNFTVTLTGNTETHTISTTVTSHPGVARDWLRYTLHLHRPYRHRLIVGMGVQWTPFNYGYYNHPAATIQLCIGHRCLIFHLAEADACPRFLRRLLCDESITFVGLWNHSDAGKLIESRHRLEMAGKMPVDLRHHLVDENGRDLMREGIQAIAAAVLGVDIEWDEEVSRSDWEVEELSLDQVKQAAVDAFVGFTIGVRINAWKINPMF